MPASTPSTILINSVGQVHFKEAPANGTVTPGDFLERATDGDLQRQATSEVAGPKLIALENDLEGDSISDDYASGDNVRAAYLKPGDEVYAFVPASAAAIVIGDHLVFDGTGCVIKGDKVAATALALSTANTYTDAAVNTAVNAAVDSAIEGSRIIATALEAVDNSGGGSKARIKIEIL
jgi:hypothetical protein